MEEAECWHGGKGMKFNSGKYKVTHLGLANENLCCRLGAHRGEATAEETNPGAFVDLYRTASSQREAGLTRSMCQLRYFQEKGKM